MREYINSIAGIVSVAACFIIAGVGVFSGIDPFTCCYRAICGAIFVYCISMIALRIIARIILTALIDSKRHGIGTESEE